MDVPISELLNLIPNNNGANENGNGQVESNENQINNNPDGNGQMENNGNQNNNCPNGNGNGQTESNVNQNCGAGEGGVRKKLTYLSLVVNGIFFGLVLCFLVLYLVGGNYDHKDDLQSSRGAHTSPEDLFYSCLPCEPMVRTDDADTMRLFMKSSSMVCCKKMIYPVVNVEVRKFISKALLADGGVNKTHTEY